MDTLFSSLSLLPIIILLVVSLLRGVRFGVYAGLALTIVLFFVWESHLIALPAALVAALVDTISILMIVFGALFLHQHMEQTGFITRIKASLATVHHHPGFQFYFLAFFLTAFFESVAGFGTPGAIVPLLLISMGFSPILSIVVVLLIDGLFAITGAIGTPVTAGLAGPLDLSPQQVSHIYLYAAGFMILSGCITLSFIRHFVKNERPAAAGTHGWKLFFALAIPFAGLSYFLQELTGVIASAIMGALSYFFLFTNRKIDWQPWLPYALLLVLLLLPKLFAPLASFIALPLSFHEIFSSSVSASLQPLKSPLLPFILASFMALWLGKSHKINLKPVLKKTSAVFLVLFPSLAITRLMLASGNPGTPSMVESMSLLFARTGDLYPLLSPFIGVMGTFITGSTTVSNIIFGPVQFTAAQNLGLTHELILAMQLNGASLGNAICLFNIIAAAAVAGVENYSAVLNKNILPVLCAALATSLTGIALITLL
ncbi:L-lactate permease [Roseivirga sp. BDSF3-8]|uniref:L-lactate permease n=1 Tax=Roseivirga sp. BDSF3-8 TaxID=3241598 RepID=UPI0035326F3F